MVNLNVVWENSKLEYLKLNTKIFNLLLFTNI